MRHGFLLFVVAAAFGAGAPETHAQTPWVDAIFPSRDHDFGTVARGSKIRHAFKLVNTTNAEIHIVNYETKCGCTEVRLGAQTIPPGTQTVIEAVLDTTKFQGPKASGLTLVFDRPNYTRVDLNLKCFIRSDVTLNPGQGDFGVVNRSTKPAVDLTLAYAGGQADWAITKMQTLSPHITARLSEQTRSGSGAVNYSLSVTLNPTAPVGFFKDEVTLYTNDPTSPTIPVSVTATVQSTVSATPSVLTLGAVKPGEEVKKTVLVRSSEAFKILGIKSTRPELSFPKAADQAKTMQPVVVTLKAPTEPGPFHAVIEIQSDVKNEPPTKINAFATVVQ
jgi:hypothetical protein